jgi:hypothetical protein
MTAFVFSKFSLVVFLVVAEFCPLGLYYLNLYSVHVCSVCTMYQQLRYFDNLLIHSIASAIVGILYIHNKNARYKV